jgi:hypothetical protein
MTDPIIVTGFGRQKVFSSVGRCIYCDAQGCDLGDEHIIPQALGGNMILPAASCHDCERIVGGQLEGRILHKTKGPFAALRLRLDFKSKRPKDRPKSLPFRVVGFDGVTRTIKIPAKRVPKYWLAYTTETSPGIIVGRKPTEAARGGVYSMWDTSDMKALSDYGGQITLQGAGDGRDLARFLAKIAHGMAVAEYGLDAFEAWLPSFILGRDDCVMHYYVAGHENKTVDDKGTHSISLGTWGDDGLRIGARIRLFCKWGTPDYEVAVGKFKEPRKKGTASEQPPDTLTIASSDKIS